MARPRSFDETEVIAQVTDAFWSEGYEETSLDDLMAATGLNRSSLYNAFGDKLDLFVTALDHYRRGPGYTVFEPLVERHGAAALCEFLKRLSAFVESPAACRGCLMVNTALREKDLGQRVRAHVDEHFVLLERGIERTYREAVADADIDCPLHPREVAAWLVAFVRGALVSAGSGVDSASIQRSIQFTGRQLGLRCAHDPSTSRRKP